MSEINDLREQIENLKCAIGEIKDMRPGSLTRQTRSWGKSYWQLSYTHRGKGATVYVSDERYEKVKAQTENYRKFKSMCLLLVDLSIELAKLLDKTSCS